MYMHKRHISRKYYIMSVMSDLESQTADSDSSHEICTKQKKEKWLMDSNKQSLYEKNEI